MNSAQSNHPGTATSGGATLTLHLYLLGGFQVSVGARTIEDADWRPRKVALLVKLLANRAANRAVTTWCSSKVLPGHSLGSSGDDRHPRSTRQRTND